MTLRPNDPRVMRRELLEFVEAIRNALDGRADDLDRLVTAARNQLHRVDIVAVVPASAPPGYLLMVPGDPNLYIGTGTGLRKVLTTIV